MMQLVGDLPVGGSYRRNDCRGEGGGERESGEKNASETPDTEILLKKGTRQLDWAG